MEFRIEYDPRGRYRIAYRTRPASRPVGPSREGAGEWASYQGIATLEVDGQRFVAFSSYWDGALPVETVFKLEAQPTRVEEAA